MEPNPIIRRAFRIIVLATGTASITWAGPPVASPGVEIESSLEGREVRWRVRNQSTPPIMRIEIPTFRVYKPEVPAGWKCDDAHDGLRAWTDDVAHAIRPGQSAEFRVTGTSSGGKPGKTRARLTPREGGVLEVPDVITLQKESRAILMVPPIIITAIVVVHVCVRRRRGRKRGQVPLAGTARRVLRTKGT